MALEVVGHLIHESIVLWEWLVASPAFQDPCAVCSDLVNNLHLARGHREFRLVWVVLLDLG
jgi:hypothetical protein